MDSPTPTQPPELTAYNASCHCGALSLTLRIPSLSQNDNSSNIKVSSCDCSICTRNGYLMVYPKRENVVFHSGFDNSEEDEEDNKGPGGSYSFRGSKRAAVHRFCKVCGSCVLCDVHADFLAVNVRMIHNLNLKTLQYKYVDGKSRGEKYIPPSPPSSSLATQMFPEETSSSSQPLTPYFTNCHCGTITYSFLLPSPSLSQHKPIIECACSICTRKAYLLVHPKRSHVVLHSDAADLLTSYEFGEKTMIHRFCRVCGSGILVDYKGDRMGVDVLGVNVRMVEGVDLDELEREYLE